MDRKNRKQNILCHDKGVVRHLELAICHPELVSGSRSAETCHCNLIRAITTVEKRLPRQPEMPSLPRNDMKWLLHSLKNGKDTKCPRNDMERGSEVCLC